MQSRANFPHHERECLRRAITTMDQRNRNALGIFVRFGNSHAWINARGQCESFRSRSRTAPLESELKLETCPDVSRVIPRSFQGRGILTYFPLHRAEPREQYQVVAYHLSGIAPAITDFGRGSGAMKWSRQSRRESPRADAASARAIALRLRRVERAWTIKRR